MHQMVDHVSAAKQHRDTNQNRNKERHDRLLSVVGASKITLGEYSGFCMEPVGHHVLKWPSWSNRGPSSRRHDTAAVPRTMQAGQSTLFHGSGARIQRNENASHSPRRGIDLLFDDAGLGSGDRNHQPHPRRALARVERTVAAEAGKAARIGVYINLKPDCTSGALPILRLTESPQGGRVVIKRAKIQVTNAGACLSTEAPGYVAFYQSRPDFSGADKVAIEIKLPDRDTVRVQKITINVRATGTNL